MQNVALEIRVLNFRCRQKNFLAIFISVRLHWSQTDSSYQQIDKAKTDTVTVLHITKIRYLKYSTFLTGPASSRTGPEWYNIQFGRSQQLFRDLLKCSRCQPLQLKWYDLILRFFYSKLSTSPIIYSVISYKITSRYHLLELFQKVFLS